MASELPTSEQVLAALSAELSPARVEVLTAAEIHRADGLVPSIRRQGGGLLCILVKDRVVEPLVRNRLFRHERDGSLEEVTSMEVAEGHMLIGRVTLSEPSEKPRRPVPATLDASLIALPDVDLEELDIRRAARRCPGDPPTVDAADSDHGRLVALGVAVQSGRRVHPSLAGLALYGRRPELWLPLQVDLVGEAATARLEGAIPALVEKACEWSGWSPTDPRAVPRALLADALAWRDWQSPEPIVVRVVGSRVRVRVPGMASVPQPAIARLMRREGIPADPARPFGRVDRWLVQQALSPGSRLRTESGVEVVIDLRRVDAAMEQPAIQSAPVGPQAAPIATRSLRDTRVAGAEAQDESEESIDPARAVVERLERGPATTKELMIALGASRFAVRSALAILEVLGRIRPEREARKSPFQRWMLVDA